MEGSLRAGVAKVDITPAVGTELCGHFRSSLRSVGVHSRLYAKAIILNDGENYVALVACDLLGVTSSLVASTRERIEELTGIPAKNVMICCTHTHSGPGSQPLRVVGKSDETYQDQLVKKIGGAVYLAYKSMNEASVGLGSETLDLAASRRVRWPDGSIRFTWLDPNTPPEEPIDRDLKVITLKNSNNKTLAVAINYACHPVTMGGKLFNHISSDFPGVATELIERAKGDGTIALFFNGSLGDIHPRKDIIPGYNYYTPIKGDELTRTLGTILGAEALKISEMSPTESAVTVQAISQKVEIPLQEVPSEDEIIEEQKRLDELKAEASESECFWIEQKISWYKYLLELYREGKSFAKSDFAEVQSIRIGDIYIVGLPGEVFSKISLEIKERARKEGIENVLLFALANGNLGYIPAEEDYTIAPIGKRGYEIEGSYMLHGRPLVGPGTATSLIETSLKLIKMLHESKAS